MSDNLPAADYTEDELEAFALAGRLSDDKRWVKPDPATVKAAAAAAVIPEPSDEIKARIAAGAKATSSFVQTDKDGRVVKQSEDGGAVAEAKLTENPDWAGRTKELPVDFADKERFLAHLLGGRSFTKSYELFGGKLSVTFRTLDCEEQASLGKQVWNDSNLETSMADGEKPIVAEERVIRYRQYHFTAALASLGRSGDVLQDFEPFKEKGNEAAGILPIKVAHGKLRKLMPYPIYAALMNTHTMFEDLVATMTLKAHLPDFWKADAAS